MLALQKLKFYHRLKRSCNDTAAAAITTAATSRPTSTRTYFFCLTGIFLLRSVQVRPVL